MGSSSNPAGSEGKTVRARRRRPAAPGTPGALPRAEAPRREGRTTSSGRAEEGATQSAPSPRPATGSSGSGTGAGTGRAPSGRNLWVLIGLVILYFAVIRPMLRSGQDGTTVSTATPAAGSGLVITPLPPSPAPAATRMTVPTAVPGSAAAGESWLVMLYQDADDKVLEKDIYVDLNEAERVGSSDSVHIVAQIDRYSGGFSDDGDWTGARRYYVTHDDDLSTVRSELIADLGEQNMADGDTLVDFATWALQTYPADKVALILSDHGMGWPGGWSDPAPATRGSADTPLGSQLGNAIYLNELGGALRAIRERSSLDKFDLVGLDACLMAQLEVLAALEPHARYAVASEETEPGLGWAYAGFLESLVANPRMSAADLSRLIVDSYILEDERIVDDQARADMMRQGTPMGALFGF